MSADDDGSVPGRDQSRGSTDQPSGRRPWARHLREHRVRPLAARSTEQAGPVAARGRGDRVVRALDLDADPRGDADAFARKRWLYVWLAT